MSAAEVSVSQQQDEWAENPEEFQEDESSSEFSGLAGWINDNLTPVTLLFALLGFGLGAGVQSASPSKDVIDIVNYPGELFIRALKMIVIPLIAFNMILAVNKLGDIGQTKVIGKRALAYYLTTTLFAATEGLIFFNIFNPGSGLTREADGSAPDVTPKGVVEAILDVGRSMIPDNLITAYIETNILGIIIFSLMFGISLSLEKRARVVTDWVDIANFALMRIIRVTILFTPIGILSLVAGALIAQDDIWGLLADLGIFIVACMCGWLTHGLLVYPGMYFFFVRQNPFTHYRGIVQAQMTAFATSSSAATMPVTIECTEKMGVKENITRFMLPLGATINMDGTAIYFPIAVLFLANVLQVEVDFPKQIIIAIMASFVSIGAAPIPSAGLVYLVLILDSVDIPAGPEISFVLAIDWFLDRCQTMLNVTGDSVGARIMHEIAIKDEELTKQAEQAEVSDGEIA